MGHEEHCTILQSAKHSLTWVSSGQVENGLCMAKRSRWLYAMLDECCDLILRHTHIDYIIHSELITVL